MATQTISPTTQQRQNTINRSMTRTRLLKWLPSLLLISAAVLLIASISFPYWGMVLEAPQYPNDLTMSLFVNRMAGNPDTKLDEVREIDGLNHYIGMRSMYDAAPIERAIAIPSMIAMVVGLGIVALIRRRWVWVLTLPALGFPFVFLADLGLWMRYYGQNLDPYAPLSNSIKPFTPSVLGESMIGQFKTIAYVDTGWYMAVTAVGLIVLALLLRFYAARDSKNNVVEAS